MEYKRLKDEDLKKRKSPEPINIRFKGELYEIEEEINKELAIEKSDEKFPIKDY